MDRPKRLVRNAPGRLKEAFIIPEGSDESEMDDSDADPDFDPVDHSKKTRLQRFFEELGKLCSLDLA